jgi:mono/diheme cytochrome c family protein
MAAGTFFHSSERVSAQSRAAASSRVIVRTERSSTSDLALSGELRGVPSGATRYVTRDDLLALPQVRYNVTDDANFTGPTEISGVPLDEMTREFAADPGSDMVVAVCKDKYRANYPHAYMADHHALLVLKINGQPPESWPKDSETHRNALGPFMISHPRFTPGFKILSQAEEPQIPWGVVQIEFRDEKSVFGAIAPRGPRASDESVQAGYRIAQQNCFRCHNNGIEGGTKAGRPWLVLSAWAAASPEYFAAYVRNPQSRNPQAQMPGNPTYDDATVAALIAYFKTFSGTEKP